MGILSDSELNRNLRDLFFREFISHKYYKYKVKGKLYSVLAFILEKNVYHDH